jgi:hypothetical protein
MVINMSMTKKDYELIAEWLKHCDSEGWTDHAELMAEELADTLEQKNTNFNRTYFLEACGITE